MITIIRNVEEITKYNLSTLLRGNFFEYEKKLYIFIKYEETIISCLNITDKELTTLSPETKIYICDPVVIKYNLHNEAVE